MEVLPEQQGRQLLLLKGSKINLRFQGFPLNISLKSCGGTITKTSKEKKSGYRWDFQSLAIRMYNKNFMLLSPLKTSLLVKWNFIEVPDPLPKNTAGSRFSCECRNNS